MTAIEPHELLRTVIDGAIPARCVQVVADLGVADQIDGEPVAAGVLAETCRVDAAALDRVLRLLAAQGVFDRRSDGYLHTDASRLLRSDHPASMRAFGQMNGLPIFVQCKPWWTYPTRSAPAHPRSSSPPQTVCGPTCSAIRTSSKCSPGR
jgi:hypothetical protein